MPQGPIEVQLARAAELGGAPGPSASAAGLAALARLIHAWNQRLNLTGHGSLEAIAYRLVAPATALAGVLPQTAGPIADLGSGAGIPGLPLALVRPTARVTLVDSRERRHFFQREAIRLLGLADRVEARRQRVETAPPRPFQLVVSQAMAPPEQALAWMRPWAAPGGFLALPIKSPDDAPRAREGLRHVERIAYRVPGDATEHWVWIARVGP